MCSWVARSEARYTASRTAAASSSSQPLRTHQVHRLQAAHIIDDRDPGGAATISNGIALCAIHHLAYDRNRERAHRRG